MSVIVKGMKMPENCDKCKLVRYFGMAGGIECLAKKEWPATSYADEKFREIGVRPDWCPLVGLPEKHGELIDRQKLLEDNKHLEYPTDGKYRSDRAWSVGFNTGAKHCNEHAVYAKTVFEAEGDQDENT